MITGRKGEKRRKMYAKQTDDAPAPARLPPPKDRETSPGTLRPRFGYYFRDKNNERRTKTNIKTDTDTDTNLPTYLVLLPDSNGIHPLVPVPTHDIAQVLQPLDLLALPPHLASTGNAHVLLSVLGDGFTL